MCETKFPISSEIQLYAVTVLMRMSGPSHHGNGTGADLQLWQELWNHGIESHNALSWKEPLEVI